MRPASIFQNVMFCFAVAFCSVVESENKWLESQSLTNSFENLIRNSHTENQKIFEIKAAEKQDEDGSGNENPKIITTSASFSPNSFFTTHVPVEILKRIENQPGVNSAIDAILVLVVIQTMLGLGCTMDIHLIKEHLYQPSGETKLFNVLFLPKLSSKYDRVAAVGALVLRKRRGEHILGPRQKLFGKIPSRTKHIAV